MEINMKHDIIFEIALTSIKTLATDKTVSKKEIQSSLETLQDVINIKLSALVDEVSSKKIVIS
tara:strand:- start:506 stop:694 length:189 start_codon:yes stop_codon:yes gene_type:complete